MTTGPSKTVFFFRESNTANCINTIFTLPKERGSPHKKSSDGDQEGCRPRPRPKPWSRQLYRAQSRSGAGP
jgi:hypothetical protein